LSVIQEPRHHEGHVRGLNIPGYTLFFTGGIDRPRACILTRNKTTWMLSGFYCRDLVAVLIKYNEDGAEWQLVICSAYLPYDSEHPPLSKELEELVQYCESKTLYLIIECNSSAHYSVWGITNCSDRGETLVEFLNSSNLEILNRGNESTFCSGDRLEVIDITLGSFGLLESITSWEVSSEPSLSDQTYSVNSTELRTSTPDQEP
jgi:hypothetical protein